MIINLTTPARGYLTAVVADHYFPGHDVPKTDRIDTDRIPTMDLSWFAGVVRMAAADAHGEGAHAVSDELIIAADAVEREAVTKFRAANGPLIAAEDGRVYGIEGSVVVTAPDWEVDLSPTDARLLAAQLLASADEVENGAEAEHDERRDADFREFYGDQS